VTAGIPSGPVGRRVDTIAPERWHAVADALADAFFGDAVFGWLLPDPATRAPALRRFFAIENRDVALHYPDSLAAIEPRGAVGAALVLPPGHWRVPVGVLARHTLQQLDEAAEARCAGSTTATRAARTTARSRFRC